MVITEKVTSLFIDLIQTPVITLCVFPESLLRILKACSLFLGLFKTSDS